ncbi:MAG: 30S ribosomal protein S8 [Croceibacter sp.]|nr:30S ribosomal protein S8 [Croceibacter sp.]
MLSYKFESNTPQGSIKIALKYDKETKESVIKDIQRISKPGLRKYSSSSEVPRILNGLGIAIVSTSKGVMTGKQAQQENVGGEVLCYVY